MNIKNSVLLISLTMSVMVFSGVTIQVNAQEDSENTDFLIIQHAQSGSISEINASTYSLEFNEVSDKTILFSDRPDRIVTTISTSDFVGNWSTGEDSFQADPPNAVLVVDGLEEQDIAIIELFNPLYELNEKKLIYVIAPDNATSIELPHNFGQSILVIDGLHHPTQY